MAPEEVVTTEVTTQQGPTDAERAAAAAAEAEQRAAQLRADTERNAAERIADFEGRVSKWESDLASYATQLQGVSAALTDYQGRSETERAETRTLLESIQQRLAPPPEPPPPSPTPPPGQGVGNPPAEPEPPPARRKAHRWI